MEDLREGMVLRGTVKFRIRCEVDSEQSCTDRCSMGEVLVENIRLAEDLVCWDMATACEQADRDRCNEPQDWIDFNNAIAECADDVN